MPEQARADNAGVLRLIVLCGYIFPEGLDQGAHIDSLGPLPHVAWDSPSKGYFVVTNPKYMFYDPECTQEQVDRAIPQLKPTSMAANKGILPPQAWEDPKFGGKFGYIFTTEDRTTPYIQQKEMVDATRGGERWVERTLVGSGHSPMLSRPGEVANFVGEIVEERNLRSQA